MKTFSFSLLLKKRKIKEITPASFTQNAGVGMEKLLNILQGKNQQSAQVEYMPL